MEFLSNFAAYYSNIYKLRNMNKLVYHSAAALVLGGLMASCSNDLDYVDIVEQKVEAYEQVFKSEFGSIDPNHTWGFKMGNEDAALGTRGKVALRRVSFSHYDFPEDASASNFLSTVPNGVEKGANFASGIGYIDETYTGEVNIWSGGNGSKLYIKGNCDFSNRKFYVGPNTEVYLLEGATLTLSNDNAGNLQSNDNYYVAPKAKIATTGELKLNNGLHIYNHGTITANKLSTNSNSLLYNKGEVRISDKISVENALSVIVNDGSITAGSLNTAGSGKFQNNANVTINGETVINSNNNTWVNNGTYNTGSFTYTAASKEVINNCRLNVTRRFTIRLANSDEEYGFKMNSDAGVLAGEFSAEGPGRVYMGSNSVFKITGTAYMGITKDEYGIYGPETGNYAVFQANNIVRGSFYNTNTKTMVEIDANQGFVANYFNKLYVVTNSHFNFGYSDKSAEQQANGEVGSQPYYKLANGAVLYTNGEIPNVSIRETSCNPGFNSNPDITIPIDQSVTTGNQKTKVTKKEYWVSKEIIEQGRVFCEDLGQVSSSDLDFNDVVFDAYIYKRTFYTRTTVTIDNVVQESESSTEVTKVDTIANIVLLAAGGTLPLSVAGVEVHNALAGVSTGTIINTIENNEGAYGNSWVTCEPKELEEDFDYKFINDIEINVIYGNGSLLKLMTEQGQAPHKICVPIGTKWAKERVLLRDAYTTFADYVNNSNLKFWESGVPENLFTLEKDTYLPRSTAPVETKLDEESTSETIGSGTTTTGGYQGGEVLSRRTR